MMSRKRTQIPKSTRELVYQKYNRHCAYCGCELEYKDMQVDHLKSVETFGEDNSFENLMPSCRMCNFYKSTYTLEKFREQLGKLRGRLEKVYIYRLSKKYDLIEEKDKEIKFYFEINEKETK